MFKSDHKNGSAEKAVKANQERVVKTNAWRMESSGAWTLFETPSATPKNSVTRLAVAKLCQFSSPKAKSSNAGIIKAIPSVANNAPITKQIGRKSIIQLVPLPHPIKIYALKPSTIFIYETKDNEGK